MTINSICLSSWHNKNVSAKILILCGRAFLTYVLVVPKLNLPKNLDRKAFEASIKNLTLPMARTTERREANLPRIDMGARQ